MTWCLTRPNDYSFTSWTSTQKLFAALSSWSMSLIEAQYLPEFNVRNKEKKGKLTKLRRYISQTRGVLARGRVTSTSYELTRIRYNWLELGTKTANFILSCRIVLIPYLIPRFSHNHQEIFTIVPYSTLIPEAIFHQEGYCRNCTVFHLVFPRLTHIFLYIFIVKYIHNILSLIPY